jgi:hypothetical protein
LSSDLQAIRNIEQGQGQPQQKKPVYYAFKYLNSPETQRQYPRRLKMLIEHVGLAGDSLEAQGQTFLEMTREKPQWAQEKIIEFIDFHKQWSKVRVPTKF